MENAPTRHRFRQGCPLSPTLFSVFIDEMVKRLLESKAGAELGERKLRALLYADDAVLIAGSAEELQSMITIVDKLPKVARALEPQEIPSYGRSSAGREGGRSGSRRP